MQSEGNRFGGDVVLDRVNMAYRDIDSILDQKYKRRHFFIIAIKILSLKSIWRNCISISITAHYNKELMKLV